MDDATTPPPSDAALDVAAVAAEARALLDAHGLTVDGTTDADRVTSPAIENARVIVALAARVTAAEAAHAALAGAVREYIAGIVRHTSAYDQLSVEKERRRLDALLRGAPGGVVRASVVAEYVRAVDQLAATRADDTTPEMRGDLATKRTALDAALAAVKETL